MKNNTKTHGENFIEIQLGVLVFQEGDSYLALCPALNLSTYADSIHEAKEAFEDLLKSYLEDCEQMGTLEKDLKANGWIFTNTEVAPPQEMDLNIPAGMLRKQFIEPFRVPVPMC